MFLIIAVFWKGLDLNSAVDEFAHSGDALPVSANIRPSKTMLLCSSVMPTFNARVRNTYPSAIVCNRECGESSSSAPSAPMCWSRSFVACTYVVYNGWDRRNHPIFTCWLDDKMVGLTHTLLICSQSNNLLFRFIFQKGSDVRIRECGHFASSFLINTW